MESYNDYMFLLKPSEPVKQVVKKCKEGVGEFIGPYAGMNGKAHISIFSKERCKPYLVRPYITSLKNKIASMPPVTIEIDGFSFFVHGPKKMTIYAQIKPSYKLDNWLELLKQQLDLKNLRLTPHITITKTIDIDSFYRVWPIFKYLNYKETFTVETLTILERETLNNRSKWMVYEELPFKNELRSDSI
jgi:hypothetical protein